MPPAEGFAQLEQRAARDRITQLMQQSGVAHVAGVPPEEGGYAMLTWATGDAPVLADYDRLITAESRAMTGAAGMLPACA